MKLQYLIRFSITKKLTANDLDTQEPTEIVD